jgi:ABC-type enterochelin transport system permease subunit
LASVFVDQLFAGWSAVSGALIAIGAALVLVGVVFSLRRTKR